MGPPEFVRLLRNVGRLESSNESVQDIMDSQLKGSKGLEDLFLSQNVGPEGLFFAHLPAGIATCVDSHEGLI